MASTSPGGSPVRADAIVSSAESTGTSVLVAADLLAATGRVGWRGTLSAAVFEPGFSTMLLHRWAVALQEHGWRRTAKLLWRVNVACSGCHIHLDARIGPGLKLPHPIGIVIGAGARVGADVTLYQHVTLGRGARDDSYPVIGDGVVVFPNAVIVGSIAVGERATVGAGAIVKGDVPSDATVAGNPAEVVRMGRITVDN